MLKTQKIENIISEISEMITKNIIGIPNRFIFINFEASFNVCNSLAMFNFFFLITQMMKEEWLPITNEICQMN